MARSWCALALQQDWLDGEVTPVADRKMDSSGE